MNKIIKCKFCKREVLLKDFRVHLQTIHPDLIKEKIQEAARVDSMDDLSLLSLFSTMSILQEDTRFNVSAGDILAAEMAEDLKGKGGEFGGAGVSESFECDSNCECCDLHEDPPEEDADSSSDDSSSDSDTSSSSDD